jgi:hypothetical protein
MTESEQRYFEMMLEQILHEVKTVAEGHAVLDEKIDRFHLEGREDHRLAMDLIKHSHDELKKEIRGVDKRFEARDAALKKEIQAVGDKVNGMDAREGALGQKADGHEERIAVLERKAA